ncbi:hypothetical protein BEL04_07135 [Mucilaginibacter sp. PPCGB 2223]|nr:hypothetical protein BEL04_07135 [Mucilaginibacter sp. PPCGB 2223]
MLINNTVFKLSYLRNLHKSKTFRAFSIYFSTTFLSKVFYFASFILFSHYLTKDDLGHLSIYNNSITLLTGFTTWGIIYNINTNFFRQKPDEFGTTFKSVLILPVINITVLMALLYLTLDITVKKFGFLPAFFWMIPLTLLFNFLSDVGLNMLRNNLMQKEFAYASGAELGIELLLATVLIVWFHFGWQARIISIIISSFFPTIFFIYFFYKRGYFKGRLDVVHWKTELLAFVPIIIMQVCIFMLTGSTNFFISYFENISRTGLFSVATNFSSIIIVVSNAVSLTLIPPMYKDLAEHKSFDVVLPKFYQYLLLQLVFFVAICVFIWVAYTYLINKNFYVTMKYAYITLIGCFLWTLCNFFLTIFLFLKMFKMILVVSAVSIAFTFCANYYLIKKYSFLGASLSTVITNLFLFLLMIAIYRFIVAGKIKTSLSNH